MSVPPDLEPALRAVEPAARLVSERKMRKVLFYLRDHGHALPLNPDLPVWIDRQDAIATDALPPETLEGHENRLLLLTPPDDRYWHHRPADELLRGYWRLLYQGAIRAAIDRKLADDALTVGRCRDRLHRLGAAAAREVEFVLESDHLADHEESPAGVYRAFAATYLDLHAFAPDAVEEFFPSLPPPAEVLAVLQTDVPFGELLPTTRPAGAAAPHPPDDPAATWDEPAERAEPAPSPGVTEHSRLLARALDVEAKGNLVRAAVLRTQAAAASEDDRGRATAAARAAVGRLVDSLGEVLHWDEPHRREWRQALDPLLAPASHGMWPRAARCLYELQTITADLGREVFAVDLPEFLRTFGRRPVVRPLPRARGARLLVRLRAAHKQLLRAGLPAREHLRLDRLFHHELHRLEHDVRHELAPVVREALTGSGFVPENRVEVVAREKVVAELLDRVCERGFVRLGDLRDTVARNQLKMPDLAGPGELVFGDPLLRADTRLSHDLDGVYRRGEFYLRLLQRASAVFFGTPWGRLLTLYVLAPFLAAYLALMMVDEVHHLGGGLARFVAKAVAGKPPPAPEDPPPDDDWVFDANNAVVLINPNAAAELATQVGTSSAHTEHHDGVTSIPTVAVLGVFLLLVFHVPPFRRGVVVVLRALWWAVRFVVWDVPRMVMRSEAVRAVRYSGPVRFFNRHLSGATAFTVFVLAVFVILGSSPSRLLKIGLVMFALATAFFNTPWGWVIQERLGERLSDWWRVVRVDLLPGLLGAILELFRRLANWVERQLYAVDEFLRYRSGDSRGSLVGKAIVGLLWFPVAYVTRFVFYLLFEPQVNPLKHFPVVTVSHKVIWPFLPEFAEYLTEKFVSLGFEAAQAQVYGGGLAAFIINGCPGIFGFIAWELKENWRLYRANRPERLRPVLVGSHGESMRGMLRPGFHSGTVPKLYRKLRAARRRYNRDREARLHHDLEHAAEGVCRFAERELTGILAASPDWGGRHVEIAAVRFGARRAVVEVAAGGLDGGPVAVAFENRDGVIAAELAAAGWLGKLSDRERSAFLSALRGLLDMAAVTQLGEQPRTPDAIPAGPLGELVRPYPWAEWVARWEPKGVSS